jgi:hypothetical protein
MKLSQFVWNLYKESDNGKKAIVRKNFQGVNGWQMTSEDYQELIRIIKEKGSKSMPNRRYSQKKENCQGKEKYLSRW